MEYTEKVAWLRRYRESLRQEQLLGEEIGQLESQARRVTRAISGMPGGGGDGQAIPRALRVILSAPAVVGGTGKMFPLLRLADFCGAPRWVLAKTGARRQRRLPVSSTGRGRRRCGSFPADRPARGTEGPMCFCKKSEKIPAFRYGSAAPAVPSPPIYGGERPGKMRNRPRERRWCRWRARRNPRRPRPLGC